MNGFRVLLHACLIAFLFGAIGLLTAASAQAHSSSHEGARPAAVQNVESDFSPLTFAKPTVDEGEQGRACLDGSGCCSTHAGCCAIASDAPRARPDLPPKGAQLKTTTDALRRSAAQRRAPKPPRSSALSA